MSTTFNKATTKRIPRQSRTVAGQNPVVERSAGRSIVMLVVFVLFAALSVLLSAISKKPEMVLALGVGLIVILAIMRWPVFGTFMSVILTVLFDGFPSNYSHTFFSELGVFRNLSYRGLPDSVVISMFELVVLLALASALALRFHQHKKLIKGPLFGPMMAFGSMVMFGEVNGLLSGGDFKISLWELRPLFYLVLLYILAVNTVDKPWHIRAVLWITIVTIGIRSLEGIYRYYTMSSSIRSDAPSILEHDDSLFLVLAIGLLAGAALWRRWLPKRFYTMLVWMTPLVIYMMAINKRRAAFLALGVVLFTILPLVWVSLRSRMQHRVLVKRVAFGVAFMAVFIAAFWNSNNIIAMPAQAVRSVFQPSERDFLSNLYRVQENENLLFTISTSPAVGIGFGKPMIVIRQMVNLQDQWALQLYMPHNNMLWLWMRMGIIGFVLFWIMMGVTVYLLAACIRLGVAHLRVLLEEERRSRCEKKPELEPVSTSTALSPQNPSLHIVRFTPFSEDENAHKLLDTLSNMKQRPLKRRLLESVEFLMLALMSQGVLASLLALAVVDQGLMSFRLSAFTGAIFGTLAAAWNMYHQEFLPPPEVVAEPLPLEEDKPSVAKRIRVRLIARA